MTIDKRALRRRFLSERQALAKSVRAEASERIVSHLTRFLVAGAYRQVLLFLSHQGEPDLTALAANPELSQVTFALPVLGETAGSMRFHAWRSSDQMVSNRYGIAEPDPKRCASVEADAATAMLVPSVALDRRGHRLGYGGGYYDRFLATHRALHTVGINFAAFVVEALPDEGHDLPVLWVATEAGIQPASISGGGR